MDISIFVDASSAIAAFTVAGAVVGHSRGRVVAGTLWSLALGPIGVIVACFIRSGADLEAERRRLYGDPNEPLRHPDPRVGRDERPSLGE